jgi:hypothetical protein
LQPHNHGIVQKIDFHVSEQRIWVTSWNSFSDDVKKNSQSSTDRASPEYLVKVMVSEVVPGVLSGPSTIKELFNAHLE